MTKKRLPVPATGGGLPRGFTDLLGEVKRRIQTAQTRAVLSVNAELVHLYWDIGRLIDQRQRTEGWGASVIPRLSVELRNELPEIKGFSERNIDRMIAFFRAYPVPAEFSPQVAAKLGASQKVPQTAAKTPDSLLWCIPWFHHVVLIEKVKDLAARRWYMEQTIVKKK